MNGQQRSDQNLSTFHSWITSKTDDNFREYVSRGRLSRQDIAKECGFAKSVLLQNPRVRDSLFALEARLRECNVLPPLEAPATLPATSETHNPRIAADKARLKRLETENAALRAELIQLRTELEHFRILDAVLSSTGRLPR